MGHRRTLRTINTITMITKVTLALALVAVSLAAPSQPAYGYAPAPTYEEPAKYDFNYAVNDFGHQEARDGYDTQGSYYVQLPDGRLQKVTFHVDGNNGYVANVEYEGEAQYPSAESGSFESVEAYRP